MTLPNNWVFNTGTYYVSKRDGDNANIGSKSLPFASISKAYENGGNPASIIVYIRNGGVYNEGGFDSTIAGPYLGKGLQLIGDGFVVIDGGGFFPFSNNNNLFIAGFFAENITFQNVNTINNGNITNRSTRFKKCRFFDSLNIEVGDESSNNLFARTSAIFGFSSARTYFRNTFVDNTTITWLTSGNDYTMLNSAFGKTTNMLNSGGVVDYTLANCAFEDDGISGFQIDGVRLTTLTLNTQVSDIGTLYTDGEKFSGALTIGTKTITFTNCFYTSDMGWNAPSKDVYTLNNSPQSILLNGNNAIGAFDLSLFVDSTNQAFDPLNSGVSISPNVTRNLVTGNFDITISPGGIVRSTDDPTKAFTLPFSTSIDNFVEFSLQGFNFFNGEWVDDENYNDPANLEVRLTYKVSVYDEIGLTWSSFVLYEINQALEQDVTGKGNGNVDADMENLGAIIGRIFRVELNIRDNGV